MNFNELSLEEQQLIIENRLDKLNLNITTGSCTLTGVILVKDENKVALAIEDKYSDKKILLSLSDDHISNLYDFIKNRYFLKKKLDNVQHLLKNNE